MPPRFELGITPRVGKSRKIVRQGPDIYVGYEDAIHREIVGEMLANGLAVDPKSSDFDAGAVIDDGEEILIYEHSAQYGVGPDPEIRRTETGRVFKEIVGDQREINVDLDNI